VVCNTASVTMDVIPWYTNFPNIQYEPQNSGCQKGDIKFHIKDPTISTATLENLVIWDSCTPVSVDLEIHL
jgi:hypothetical protein